MMATALGLLGLVCLAFILWLTVDGLRAIAARRAAEIARQPLHMVVAERREVAGELLSLRLIAAKGRVLPSFRAGQHVLLQAPAGPGGKTIRRAYSLAAWQPRPKAYELGIKREAMGAMTPWLWEHLQEGSAVTISRPQGTFAPPRSARPLVLIGGGIGITPMRAMIHEGAASGRQIVLFHAARTAGQLLYRDEFERLAASHPNFSYLPILSRPQAGAWPGLSGRLDAALILAQAPEARDAEFCLCAADSMMAQLRADLTAAGIDEHRLHWEAFGVSAGAGSAGLPLAVQTPQGSRQYLTRGAPTLLAELEANEVALPSECRAGSCGQCLATLDSGEVDWLAKPEIDIPAGKILPCICAPRSPLALSIP